nr:MAG TPA: hypothetical protein [Bacteriophage sp.]
MPSPGCGRTRAEKRRLLCENQVQGEYTMKNPYLQEATEIIRGRMVYVANLGQTMLSKLTPTAKETKC